MSKNKKWATVQVRFHSSAASLFARGTEKQKKTKLSAVFAPGYHNFTLNFPSHVMIQYGPHVPQLDFGSNRARGLAPGSPVRFQPSAATFFSLNKPNLNSAAPSDFQFPHLNFRINIQFQRASPLYLIVNLRRQGRGD
jgi:hypothetical protein